MQLLQEVQLYQILVQACINLMQEDLYVICVVHGGHMLTTGGTCGAAATGGVVLPNCGRNA